MNEINDRLNEILESSIIIDTLSHGPLLWSDDKRAKHGISHENAATIKIKKNYFRFYGNYNDLLINVLHLFFHR